MSSKQQGQQESSASYMDGVMVKISEQYKPPPRINLPISYSQRLLLNKQLQNDMGKYEFTLEMTIKERMTEWKAARAALSDEFKQRLEKLKEMRNKENLTTTDDDEDDTKKEEQDEYLPNMEMLIPTVATTNSAAVLKPMPLSNLNSKPYICKAVDKSPFNISDFEADTSSPFDNVELKTINDMAELALVLQTKDNKNLNTQQYSSYLSSNSFPYINYNQRDAVVTSNQYSYSSPLPPATSTYVQPTNSNLANGYYYTANNTFQTDIYASPYAYNSSSSDAASPQNSTDESKLPFRSIPDIMKALETDLNHTHLINQKHNNQIVHSVNASNHKPDASQEKSTEKSDELEDPYKTLPKNLQQLSKLISGMGFPLSRVARACKQLGDDQKKVVEHLLAMSELLDLGFSETQVSSALLKCNNDRDKALDLLIL